MCFDSAETLHIERTLSSTDVMREKTQRNVRLHASTGLDTELYYVREGDDASPSLPKKKKTAVS